MMHAKRIYIGIVGLVIIALAAAGCFFERISWSPDGRYVAFADHEGGNLWRWDSQTGRTEEISLSIPREWSGAVPVTGKVMACRYLPTGDRLLCLAETKDGSDDVDLFLRDMASGSCSRVDTDVAPYFDASPDGKRAYYMNTDFREALTVTTI